MEFLVTNDHAGSSGNLGLVVTGLQAGNAECWHDLAAHETPGAAVDPARPLNVWRTIGLFDAQDDDQLRKLLGSTPLHAWQTHDVTTLFEHPNDPAHTGLTSTHIQRSEFLIASLPSPYLRNSDAFVVDARGRSQAIPRVAEGRSLEATLVRPRPTGPTTRSRSMGRRRRRRHGRHRRIAADA